MKIQMLILPVAAMALLGCATSPVTFKESSCPVPPSGYTVCGSDVTGTSDQVWAFGMGGSFDGQQQHRAFREALGHAQGADALIGMSIEQSSVAILPFFMMSKVTVSGTPVKFNK